MALRAIAAGHVSFRRLCSKNIFLHSHYGCKNAFLLQSPIRRVSTIVWLNIFFWKMYAEHFTS